MAIHIDDAVYMGNVQAVEVDPFDGGQRALWMFKAKNSRGEDRIFACVLEEKPMTEMVQCLEQVADIRSKAVAFVKSVPQKTIDLIAKSRG